MESLERPLKIFVNKDLMVASLGYLELLYPFFGPLLNQSDPYAKGLHKYLFDKKYFDLVSNLEVADYYVIPHDYWQLKTRRPDILKKMLDEAKTAEKPILIDASGDAPGKIEVTNSVILRLNQYRFNLPDNEVTVPFACEDLLETYCNNQMVVRQKNNKPVVGFVGWAGLSFKQRIRTTVKESPYRFLSLCNKKYQVYRKGVFWRQKAIKIFGKSNSIKTNFIIRQSYSGHNKVLVGDPQKNRLEFVNNLLESDYGLVVRGDANASVRFYETLSLGRIPIFIDTACVLPLEDQINYKEFCLFIDYPEIKKAPEILADFHSKISEPEFIAMQEKARYIFKHFLRRDAFSKYLAFILKSRLSS